jgi:hypothetical protein
MKLLFILLFIPFTNAPISYRQLAWSDFKGEVPANTEASACTCTNISVGVDTAYAIFIPERSWTKTSDPEVLRHEQLHFAITKKFAEKVFWYLRARCMCSTEIGTAINDWRVMEQQYDDQTDHGRNTEAQKQWEEKIKL